MKFTRYWNGRVLGLIPFIYVMSGSIFRHIYDKLHGFLLRISLKDCGKSVGIQSGTVIKNPGQVSFKDNVSVGRKVVMVSELESGFLNVGNGVQINERVHLDFSGGLELGCMSLISSDVIIYTHSHGLNPRSEPIGTHLTIQEGVWIGTGALITSQVNFIGKGAVVGAFSVVTKDVLPGQVVGGNPSRVIKTVN